MAAASESQAERRPVNSYANVHVGKDEVGNIYRVMDLDGTVLEEEAKVASQGTLYVGNAYANDDVLVQKIRDTSEEDDEDDDSDESDDE